MEYRVSEVGSGPRHDIGGFFGRLAVRSALSRGRGSTACCPRCLEVGLAILGRPLAYCSWFLVRCSWSFFVLGLRASISTPCPHAHLSPCPLEALASRARVSLGGCLAGFGSANRAPWRGFSTLSEALKRPSVRLGAPTACARHWLSQRETSRSEDPPAVEKIRIRIQQT
jgi:hypothetical protein